MEIQSNEWKFGQMSEDLAKQNSRIKLDVIGTSEKHN